VRVLGIETSTPRGSIAIVDGEEIIREYIWFSQKGHISLLPKFFSSLFDETGMSIEEIDLIAVSIGPGSFTGLRIGLGFAKGISLVYNKPVKGVSSLKVLASGVHLQSKIYPVLDAKRGFLYSGCYSWKGKHLSKEMEEGLFLPEEVSRIAMDGVLVGNGIKRFESVFSFNQKVSDSHLQYPLAHNLCTLAISDYEREGADDLFSLTPHYIAPPPISAEKISQE